MKTASKPATAIAECERGAARATATAPEAAAWIANPTTPPTEGPNATLRSLLHRWQDEEPYDGPDEEEPEA